MMWTGFGLHCRNIEAVTMSDIQIEYVKDGNLTWWELMRVYMS
jgi:hypothetical protein